MRFSRIAALLLILSTALAACTSAQQADPPKPRPAPRAETAPLGVADADPVRLHWTGCGGRFQCATARVPLDYRDPHGKKISLALTRLPAAKPDKLIGPLFVNYGGPGTEAIGELTEHAQRFPASLRQRFDLIAFDPRGVGASSGLGCPTTAGPVGSPMREATRQRFFQTAAQIGKRCARRAAEMLPHMSTANSARDMELLRRALGSRPLNLLGYSYGTYLGATYANLFPEHTRAMVFDGALNLVANAAGERGQQHLPVDVRADVAGSQAAELDRFFALCKAAKRRCAFSAGNPKARFADLVAALKSGRGGPGGLASLLDSVNSGLQSASRWTYLAQTLQSTYAAVSPRGGGDPGAPTLDPYLPTHSAEFLATQCVDSVNPAEPADYVSLARREDKRSPYFGVSAVFNMASCIGWPAKDRDRYLGPWNKKRAHPILVVNNRHDPATPHGNAESTVDQLGNAGLLTIEGYGHTSLNQPSQCAAQAAAHYFVTAELPQTRSCTPDARPFS